MKQHITIEQWDEINLKQKIIINKLLFPSTEYIEISIQQKALIHSLQIGEMIEILGINIGEIFPLYTEEGAGDRILWWEVQLSYKTLRMINLCDALWEAIKYILNNKE